MAQQLSERARQVLAGVISNYVTTAEPVGSRTISKMDGFAISSATIRNVMADLEEAGLLHQPHASAGRVPTVEGLRFYVEKVLEVRELDEQAKTLLRQTVEDPGAREVSDLLKAVSRRLSAVSQQVAVVAAPRLDHGRFRRMEFVLLKPGLALVVLVADGGVVQNRVIEVDQELRQEDLDKYTRYLNDLLRDLNLFEVKQRLAQEMAREKARFDVLTRKALKLGQIAVDQGPDSDVYVVGQSNLLGLPEFADLQRLRLVFQAFEEKSTLLRLLEKSQAAQGVQIFIGSESEVADLDDITAVVAAYGGDNRSLGALGVIGPTRMDYSKVIPVVDYTAKLVSAMLNDRA